MLHRPLVVAFDVMETLFPLEPLTPRLEAAGLPGHALQVWFPRLLRDGFAQNAVDLYKGFAEVARASLTGLMIEHGIDPQDPVVTHVLAGFAELAAHFDVRPSFEALQAAGVRVVTLANGSAKTMQSLLRHNGLEQFVEKTISIDESRHWKPDPRVYLRALGDLQVRPEEVALVAAHAWDVQGAMRAGMIGAWLPRTEKQYSSIMTPPDVRGADLVEVTRALLELPQK